MGAFQLVMPGELRVFTTFTRKHRLVFYLMLLFEDF